MREILFRGKRINNEEWVYGDLTLYSKHMSYIKVDLIEGEVFQVLTETVGQFVGSKDKNDIEIFEGDIIEQENEIGKVQYESNYYTFAMILKRNSDLFKYIKNCKCEVLGNIYDNPEMLTK